MKNRFTAIILSAILVSGLAFVPAYGQGVPLTIETDAVSYGSGDRITVSGTTSGSGDITLRVVAPNGNFVSVDQITPNSNGSYLATIGVSSAWSEGEYKINIQSGSLSAKTSFFIGDATSVLPSLRDNEVRVTGTEGVVSFEITGGSINSVVPNLEATSLTVTITADDDGELTLTIPKSVLDATGKYPDFIVFIDNEERVFEEISNTDSNRVLQIPFLAGDSEIEIVGTFVIPEFGTIAIIILAIAIVSIIGLSFRSRLTIPTSI